MAQWNNPVITNKGIKMLNTTLNNTAIRVSKVKVSSKKYTADLSSLTSIADIKAEFNPSAITVLDNKLKISAILNNENERNGYNLETIGIYTTGDNDEILFAIITAESADFIPANRGQGTITINFDLFLNIDSNANFSIDYNSNALLKSSDVNSLIDNKMQYKANKTDVITDINISNNNLIFTKNNLPTTINLPKEIDDATDTKAGKISKNSIKEVIRTGLISTDTIPGVITNNKVKEIVRDNTTQFKTEIQIKEIIKNTIQVAEFDDIWGAL